MPHSGTPNFIRGRTIVTVVLATAFGLLLGACRGDAASTTVTVVTHDSFAVSDEVIAEFEQHSGFTVQFLESADAGTMVSEAILTQGKPIGDVLFGVDNTFLGRALESGIFRSYESPALANVPTEFQVDDGHFATPVDYGDVCINYWVDAFDEPPASLADLTDPIYEGLFVTQNPETSSPGMAMLLATVAAFGEEGWEDYWKALRANGVAVTSGWSDAYYGDFVGAGGDRPLVTSYASSPVAEVIYADPAIDVAPTAIIEDSCFRQIEFAGVLDGAKNVSGAEQFIDFLLSDTFQNDVPLNMFVYPVSSSATLPAAFVEHSVVPATSATLDPVTIEANRSAWTERWVEIVLR